MKRNTKSTYKNINLIVVGNGFDLACGEKTSIFDFVNSILRNPNNSWSHYKLNFIVLLIWYMSDETGGQRWIDFLNLNNAEFNDWMDFEKIVNHLVLDEQTYSSMEEIYNNPSQYKKSAENGVQHTIASYFLNFRGWHHELFAPGDTYLEFLEKAVLEFETQLLRYLVSIDSDRIIYAHKELLLRKLRSKYERTSVMDFNYTSLPYHPLYHPVFHMHGNKGVGCLIGIDPYYNKPGANDLYKTLGEKIRFTKVFKRFKYTSREELQQLNRITFFGHSLGEQDYSYFQSVFDYINLYESDVVLIFCYTEYDKEAPIKEIDRLTQRVFKLINRYGETLTNKDHGNNLLNKLLLEGRLVFKELDPEEIFNKEDLDTLLKQYEVAQ